jgi:hypothetical protein
MRFVMAGARGSGPRGAQGPSQVPERYTLIVGEVQRRLQEPHDNILIRVCTGGR